MFYINYHQRAPEILGASAEDLSGHSLQGRKCLEREKTTTKNPTSDKKYSMRMNYLFAFTSFIAPRLIFLLFNFLEDFIKKFLKRDVYIDFKNGAFWHI